MPKNSDPFIVAEVSKNWINGQERTPGSGLIAQQFERVINFNHERGYRLVAFRVHRLMVSADEMNETIIAVFESSETVLGALELTADDHA